MKIVLIDPPNDADNYNNTRIISQNFFPPLWALSLATYLRDRMSEAEIRILDGQMLKISDILKELDRITPDIVGLGPIWLNYKNALAIARQSKKIKSRVIMGGHYATGLAKEILANRGICSDDYCIDAIIQGDGEEAFYQFILGLPFKKIKNLVALEKSSR